MYDWPVASTILGIIGAAIVAILKFVPQRAVVENAKGEPCASKEDVRNVQQSLSEHHKYTETRNHDMINAMATMSNSLNASLVQLSHDMVLLLERSRHRNAQDDDA